MKNWQKQLIDFWNSHEPYFEDLRESSYIYAEERQAAFQFVTPNSRILDVACGNGANGVTLEQRVNYWGVDISFGAIRHAICKSTDRLICGDVHHLPFLDESFDVVIGTCALEHFFFPQMGLREMHRVARSRGRIILFGPCWDLPYWFPPSVKRRMSSWKSRLRYTTSRLTGQIWGWLSGRLPFHCVEEPEVLTESFKCDEDAVYVVWVYEVLAYMQKLGFRCTHLAIYDKFLGRNALIRSIKRLLYLLPIYKCGGAFLALFEKT